MLHRDIERMTAEGETTGTAAYLSPEQVAGTPLTAASDVYSLGLVLLQSFTRAIEFPGSMVESAMARLSREQSHRPVGRELVSMLRQAVIADSARHGGGADRSRIDLRTANIPHEEPVIIEDGQSDPRSQNSHPVNGPMLAVSSRSDPLPSAD